MSLNVFVVSAYHVFLTTEPVFARYALVIVPASLIKARGELELLKENSKRVFLRLLSWVLVLTSSAIVAVQPPYELNDCHLNDMVSLTVNWVNEQVCDIGGAYRYIVI